MILLSYNCRGLASPHKKSSIKRMNALLDPQIILLQETMGPRDMVKEVLESSPLVGRLKWWMLLVGWEV